MRRWLGRSRGLLALLCLLAARTARAEDVSVLTYYPAPRAIYEELWTTGDATNGGHTRLATGAASRVTVGFPLGGGNPAAKMDVNGNVLATVRFFGIQTVPTGAIAMFGGGCPGPAWVRVGAFDGYVIRADGVGSAMSTGGGPTGWHTHTLGHSHPIADPPPAAVTPAGTHSHVVNTGHDHTFGGGAGSILLADATNDYITDDEDDFWAMDENHYHRAWPVIPAGGGGILLPVVPDHTHVVDVPGFATGWDWAGTSIASNEIPKTTLVFCQHVM